MGFSALTLSFLLLAFVPHQLHASNHGLFGTKYVTTNVDGICTSSVIVHGYKCQELEVTTKDGYILSLQRIPEGRGEVSGTWTKKQPVIIQHGVLVDGMTWLLNPPEQDLPLILADNGFDVWIANTRGTRYSRRHISLDPSNPAFWNWSWDELVAYDLPAVFDYVFKETGQKINYVGHSLGTLIALASFSEGKLVNQVKSAALLSPIAYLSHMNTALGVVAAKTFVGEFTTLFGLAEFNPRGIPVNAFLHSLCAYPGIDCYDLLTALTAVRDGFLSKFNYVTPTYNYMHYGELFPPIYNLSNIPHDIPIFISYGGKDALSDVHDVVNLLDSLKFHDVDKLSVQFIKDYAHADYIMGINARDIVYNVVLAFFNRPFNI
ncbi:hypothetical protein TanjilG_15361 [Lupinus angustifolius]|uniref:Lipase n=1 Tax=Lupinus angustifolius TaxID=3871 RepID=A0A1J7HNS2_LUPAN|nr:hypothetical protein TanjilG_15361 [Lupinus angustifolius]